MSDSLKISEMFESIQGEGPLIGVPSLFVRLQGCNLTTLSCGPCSFCDTAHALSFKKFTKLNETALIQKLTETRYLLLVVTGGEPLVQQDMFLDVLFKVPSALIPRVNVETNGTIPPSPLWPKNTLFSVSPKVHTLDFLQLRSFTRVPRILKVVYDENAADSDLLRFIYSCASQLQLTSTSQVYVMPKSQDRATYVSAGLKCFEFCMKFGFRFGPREHLVLFDGVRGT